MFCSQSCINEFSRRCEKFSVSDISKTLAGRSGMQLLTLIGSDEPTNSVFDEAPKTSIFDYDLSQPENQETKQNMLRCFLSFQEKTEAHIDQTNNIFGLKLTPDANRNVHRFQKIFERNKIAMSLKVKSGFVALLFGSLMNNSCDPNVRIVDVDGKFFAVVRQPIEASEQLFISYMQVRRKKIKNSTTDNDISENHLHCVKKISARKS